MADVRTSILGDHRVQVVDGARVVVVQPGIDDVESTLIAAVFVWNDVVRFIRANAVVARRTHGSAGQRQGGCGPVTAIPPLRNLE